MSNLDKIDRMDQEDQMEALVDYVCDAIRKFDNHTRPPVVQDRILPALMMMLNHFKDQGDYKANLFYAKVRVPAARNFPLDMLRYDSAWILDEGHANAVERNLDSLYDDYEIIVHVAKRAFKHPRAWNEVWSCDRWKSKFGVDITPLDSIPF